MARITTWRLAAAAIAVTALTLTGCGGGGDNPAPAGTGTTSGDAAIGGAPASASAGAPGASSTGGGSNGSGGGSGGSGGSGSTPGSGGGYPKDAKGYVQELVKAMAKPDYVRISQLAVQSAVQQIKDSVTAGGNPNTQWPYVACTANTGPNQSTCVARNTHGDQLTVKLNQLQLGFPTAVLEAPLDRTTYPNNPGDYANAVVYAYVQGNQQRMVRLSSDTVASKIKCDFGKMTSTAQLDGTYTKVTMDGVGVDLGKKYEFKVLTAPGGKANAVKEVLVAQC
jgi:hypothetical protein